VCATRLGRAEGTRRLSSFDDLWAAQEGRCAICGEAMPQGRFDTPHATVWKKKRPTFDHIRPRKKGGADDRSNLQLAHAECNWKKGSSWKPERR
jgi:5-methylcytosine-specific restriction endonuclease McrA